MLSEAVPQLGAYDWVFLTRSPVPPLQASVSLFGGRTHIEDMKPPQEDAWFLVGGQRGCIAVTDAVAQDLKRYVEACIAWYIAKTGAAIEMAELLAEMRESPDERLRDDAGLDTLRFYMSLSEEERSRRMGVTV